MVMKYCREKSRETTPEKCQTERSTRATLILKYVQSFIVVVVPLPLIHPLDLSVLADSIYAMYPISAIFQLLHFAIFALSAFFLAN